VTKLAPPETLGTWAAPAAGAPPPHPGSGPQLSDAAFACIAGIAYREAGLTLAPAKAAMVRTRLARRLRALKLTDYDTYCTLVQDPAQRDELAAMISALTTNVSHFFREQHHFDRLSAEVLPQLRDRLATGGRIRIWSAGCSHGQEPYSIAIALAEAGILETADVRILATDIDPSVITHARNGIYPERMMTGLTPAVRSRYFDSLPESDEPRWRAKDGLRQRIAFRELNLLRDWPMRGPFDVIFCRNVVIYFDQPTQDRLWPRFAQALNPGGWLFLGHSERVGEAHHHLYSGRGATSYQRSDAPVRPPLSAAG